MLMFCQEEARVGIFLGVTEAFDMCKLSILNFTTWRWKPHLVSSHVDVSRHTVQSWFSESQLLEILFRLSHCATVKVVSMLGTKFRWSAHFCGHISLRHYCTSFYPFYLCILVYHYVVEVCTFCVYHTVYIIIYSNCHDTCIFWAFQLKQPRSCSRWTEILLYSHVLQLYCCI